MSLNETKCANTHAYNVYTCINTHELYMPIILSYKNNNNNNDDLFYYNDIEMMMNRWYIHTSPHAKVTLMLNHVIVI